MEQDNVRIDWLKPQKKKMSFREQCLLALGLTLGLIIGFLLGQMIAYSGLSQMLSAIEITNMVVELNETKLTEAILDHAQRRGMIE